MALQNSLIVWTADLSDLLISLISLVELTIQLAKIFQTYTFLLNSMGF